MVLACLYRIYKCTLYTHTTGDLSISDVYYVKPMLLPHGGWPMATGPVARLKSAAKISGRLADRVRVAVAKFDTRIRAYVCLRG